MSVKRLETGANRYSGVFFPPDMPIPRPNVRLNHNKPLVQNCRFSSFIQKLEMGENYQKAHSGKH